MGAACINIHAIRVNEGEDGELKRNTMLGQINLSLRNIPFKLWRLDHAPLYGISADTSTETPHTPDLFSTQHSF